MRPAEPDPSPCPVLRPARTSRAADTATDGSPAYAQRDVSGGPGFRRWLRRQARCPAQAAGELRPELWVVPHRVEVAECVVVDPPDPVRLDPGERQVALQVERARHGAQEDAG